MLTKDDLNEMRKMMSEEMDKRFDGVDTKLAGIDKRFDGVDTKFDGIDKRFDRIDKQLKK
jgi:hypothetical protein